MPFGNNQTSDFASPYASPLPVGDDKLHSESIPIFNVSESETVIPCVAATYDYMQTMPTQPLVEVQKRLDMKVCVERLSIIS